MRKLGSFLAPVALLVIATAAAPAHAYIGPGAGAGTIAIVLGILSSIFFAFVGILWYPIKRLIKAIKGKKPAVDSAAAKVEEPGPSSGTGG